jgi:hypothetical protein
VDGKELSPLKSGEVLVVEIESGTHSLRVNNTYHSKTVEFDVQPGEQVHYSINNNPSFIGWFMLSLLGGGPMHIKIERADEVSDEP